MKITRSRLSANVGPITDVQWEAVLAEEEHRDARGVGFVLDDAAELIQRDRKSAQADWPRAPSSNGALQVRAEALGRWARTALTGRGRLARDVARWRRMNGGVRSVDDLHVEITGLVQSAHGLASGATLEWLELTDDGSVEHRAQVPAGSHLDELARLAARVAYTYRMLARDATLVVACDASRAVEPLLARVERRRELARSVGGPGPLSRIILEIDPMVPPEIVKRGYEEVRRSWFPGARRIQGVGQIRLAGFLADQVEAKRWVDAEAGWVQVEGVSRSPNFARDAHRAVQQLLR